MSELSVCIIEGETIVTDINAGTDPYAVGLDACMLVHGGSHEKPTALTFTIKPDFADFVDEGQYKDGNTGDPKAFATGTGAQASGSTVFVVFMGKKGQEYFAGDVTLGQSFTGDIGSDTKFAAQTFIKIYNSEADYLANATPLQDIEYHASCSAPIEIGDQIGSVVLTGFTLPISRSTQSETFSSGGSTLGSGDAGTYYVITGGDDADKFTVNATTGEVSFINAPDFENPTDANGDNTYDVIVTAYTDSGQSTILSTHTLDICVEDDCIKVNSGTSVIADLDHGSAWSDIGTRIKDAPVKAYPDSVTLLFDDMVTDQTSFNQSKGSVTTYSLTENGDGQVYVVVHDDDDGSPNKIAFEGLVDLGSALELDADAIGKGSFKRLGVDIYDGPGRTNLLQEIDISTKASDDDDDLVIGDQFGTVQVMGFASTGGAQDDDDDDDGLGYDFGGLEAGDQDVTYEIGGGADAALFTVDPATGVMLFIAPPAHIPYPRWRQHL